MVLSTPNKQVDHPIAQVLGVVKKRTMSQKPLQPSRKRKPLELRNQPKLTGFVFSSPKPQVMNRKTEEKSAAIKFNEEKYKHLFESTPAKSPKKLPSKKQVLQIESDTSEPDMTTEERIFKKKTTKVAKKHLFSHKTPVTSQDSESSENDKGKQMRSSLKENKSTHSFNITKTTEGPVTKFSSEYKDESDAPSVPKKKRFYMNSGDSKDLQINIPSISSAAKSKTKRKSSKKDERHAKKRREDKDSDVIDSTSSSSVTPNSPKAPPADKHIPKNFKEILAKPIEDFKKPFHFGNLPIKKRIIRKSALNADNSTQHDSIYISKKLLVDLELARLGASLAYADTHKDLETLLDMQFDRKICPDLKQAMNCERSLPDNRYHVNFKFYMERDNYEGAVSSLRCVTRNFYPNVKDLHATLYSIIEKTNEEGVLHLAQNLLYKVLSLHPPFNQTMRKYYYFLLSKRQNDPDISAPWENLMNLIEDVLGECEMKPESLFKASVTAAERKRAVLGFIVQLLYEDFCCWIRCTNDHAENLRIRNNVPLIADVLWPRSAIPTVNSSCRELIKLHMTALQSSPDHLFFTQPLVKMMAAITQLTDLTLPLKFRRPNADMVNLAREIVILAADSVIVHQSHFFSSFGSRELQLLLPLVILKEFKPANAIPSLQAVSLKNLIEAYLKVKAEPEPEKLLESFKEETVQFRQVFLSALSAYFNLFGTFKVWHCIAHELRFPSALEMNNLPVQDPAVPENVFSSSFTLDDFVSDLRQANTLLKKVTAGNKLPKKSLYSILALNSH